MPAPAYLDQQRIAGVWRRVTATRRYGSTPTGAVAQAWANGSCRDALSAARHALFMSRLHRLASPLRLP